MWPFGLALQLLLHDIKELAFKMEAYNHADRVNVIQKSFLQNPQDHMQWAGHVSDTT